MKLPDSLLLLALCALTAPLLPAAQPKSLADIPDVATDAELAGFVVPEGFEVNLWAAEPMLHKPVQMNWDAKGRLWVVCSQTYPQIKPGEEAADQIVVLEDTNHDGKADKSTVFADNLHIPTALIPADGGCYVANSTEILFLKDSDGDGKADVRQTVFSGFGTEDTHHLIHTFRFTPEGMISFNQSIYIHSHVETPYGVKRLMGGGVWEFRPETRKLDVFCKGFINPWGREFDRWGQSFVTDGAGSGGINFVFPQAVFATSPGAKRIIDGLNAGQPKQAGLEIVDEPHFPDEWQGTFITCDFRGGRLNRFQLAESGSGYTSKQLPDVIASKHPAFRPIDVRTGPDGALYIADWYNPIIQHGEVDFRDPRRDHTHGRIWRLAAKGRPLSENPDFGKMDVSGLLKQLESNRRWNRLFAKREMRNRQDRDSNTTLRIGHWHYGLDRHDPKYWLNTLEAAWAQATLNTDPSSYVQQLLASPDHHVRSAALRILSQNLSNFTVYYSDYLSLHADFKEILPLLEHAIADEHPQVRLWAIACLNLMQKPEAVEVALRALDKPMDNILDFLLELTCREQADVWLPVFLKGDLKLNSNPKHLVYALKATGKPEALRPLLGLLESGKLTKEDTTIIAGAIGDAADSGGIKQALKLAVSSLPMDHLALLDAAVKAGEQRKIVPEYSVDTAHALFTNKDPQIAVRGALLAGIWKVESLRGELESTVTNPSSRPELRQAAIRGLTYLGGQKTRDLFDSLTKLEQPASTRTLAIVGLSELNPALGAKRAAEFLSAAKSADEGKAIIYAFIKTKKLPDVLAKELEGKTIPEAVAIEGIRIVSSRSIKGPLEAALQKAGGIKQMTQVLTPEQMSAMVAKVKSQGDPKRGEQVFRRAQLLCFTCHAIGEGGGLLGPNLISLGSAAPVDYIIESMLEPSKKIKEGYNMTMVSMKDGNVMAGMIAQDGNEELVLRDAVNQLHKLPKSNIAQRTVSPVSMMPPGMTATLREDEFIDLVRFLSELGKEGDYKVKPNRYVRAWRVMGPMEQVDIDHVRHTGLAEFNNRAHAFPWSPGYSTVNGSLPLGDLAAAYKLYPWFPKTAQFDLKLDSAGKIKLGFSGIRGVILIVDDKKYDEITPEMTLDLAAGRHVLSVLVQAKQKTGDGKAQEIEMMSELRVEILDGAAQVVTGM